MNTNPHLEAKIDELYASGKTIREIIELAVLKDVQLVALESRIVVLESALEMFADEENWQDEWNDDPPSANMGLEWVGDENPIALAQAALG